MTQLKVNPVDCARFQQAIEHEWLIGNGIGGFAAGTVAEANTRRYHGLLMAALTPPGGRTLLVAKLDLSVRYLGRDYALFSNEFADGTVAPEGYQYLRAFYLDQGLPVWQYDVGDAVIEKRILMQPGHNATLIELKILRASSPLAITLTPLCTYRDYHDHTQGGWLPNLQARPDEFEITAFPGAIPCRIRCEQAEFSARPDWYWRFKHRMEAARGLDDTEDLFCPGHFSLALSEGGRASVILSAEALVVADFDAVRRQIHRQQRALLQGLPAAAPDWIRQLALAADQFIVERYRDGQPAGKTVIAGYPWFSDWGRDTMIALPGLTLALGRFEIAADILRTFADHVSQGMIPNRFPDQGGIPEYNTADATLWFMHALEQYRLYSGDSALSKTLYPLLADIIAWHRKGSRFGIKADPNDGLLMAGEMGVQVTWMDAKVDDWVVTPRIGKCVEINALWYNALQIMAGLAQLFGTPSQAADYRQSALQVKNGFKHFWNEAGQCLYDVIDGPEGDLHADDQRYDDRLRPNQLLAVSLPHSPLCERQCQAVVDLCARELVTPFGLRSLAATEPDYAAHYRGNPRQRDAAYHQGTVWAWLIGPFVEAHYRVYRDTDKALSYLDAFRWHLGADCLGQVSEIFDAEPPFTPRGCFAQAWSVAEILRVWCRLQVHRDRQQ